MRPLLAALFALGQTPLGNHGFDGSFP
jgi:hypothetical protein